MAISLSDHFTYRRLLRFVLPTVVMMIFTSIYGIVDGLFVSNFVGKTPFAAINLIMPFVCVIGGMGFMIGLKTTKPASEVVAKCMENGVLCLTAKDKVRLLPALNIPMDVLKKAASIIMEACK